MDSVSANTLTFGFIQHIESSGFDWQSQVDFLCKCYNLFLLYFYFEIMKYVVSVVQKVIRRASRFSK